MRPLHVLRKKMKTHITVHCIILCILGASIVVELSGIIEYKLTKNIMSYFSLGFVSFGSLWGLQRLLSLQKRIEEGAEITVNTAEAYIFPYPIIIAGIITYLTSISI